MGIEYALVHDETHEAYELGKGCWSELQRAIKRSNTNFQEIHHAVVEIAKWWRVKDKYAGQIAEEIFEFLRTHPRCRLVNDASGDEFISADPFTAEELSMFGKENCFRQVGSRYRERASLTVKART